MAAFKSMSCILSTLTFITVQAQPPRVQVSDWEIQPYQLPQDFVPNVSPSTSFGPGVAGATLASDGNIYYFGGLYANIPIREFIDIPTWGRLTLSERDPQWEFLGELSSEDGFGEPHFTNGHNSLHLDSDPDGIFLTCEDSAQGQIWRFDYKTGTFVIIATMPIPLEDCCPVAIGDKIYIFGGDDNAILYNTTQIYDYHTNSWSVGAEIPIKDGIDYHGCEDVNDEFVFMFGGESRDYTLTTEDKTIAVNNGFKYNVADDSWEVLPDVFAEVPNWAESVIFLGITYIPGTPYILITGGNNIVYDALYDNAEIFNIDFEGLDPVMSAAVNNMHFPRGESVSVRVQSYDRRDFSIVSVYVIGGRTSFIGGVQDWYTNTTEVIDFMINYASYSGGDGCNGYYDYYGYGYNGYGQGYNGYGYGYGYGDNNGGGYGYGGRGEGSSSDDHNKE